MDRQEPALYIKQMVDLKPEHLHGTVCSLAHLVTKTLDFEVGS